MSKKTKKIGVKELVPGMILAKEVIQNNIKLLEKEMVITSNYIKKIQNLDSFMQVCVYDDEQEEEEIQDFISKSAIELKKKEQVLKTFSNKLSTVFKSIENDTKPNMKELRELQKNILEESKDYGIIIKSIVNAREVDEYFCRHSINVSILSYMLGRWMGFNERDLTLLSYSGILHDIGKVKININILNKPFELTPAEFEAMKKHTVIGYEVVKQMPYLNEAVAFGVLMHHEKVDGSGYPLKLSNDKIHIFGKIIAIADIFDAMTSNTAYRKKESPLKALELMKQEAINKLDLNCWTVFFNNMINYYIGEMVRLNTGEIGKIIKIDPYNICKPLIMVNSEFIDLKQQKNVYIEDLV
ncbi:HD-GYP domain-containing protein [Clostridium aestuarii]|uniref:HD-GYP domain-containing protein n=1 Tax=Clostridium aestuarii TaxID=338193 RepID=A0ABT4CZQ5_9CLOT|nr:HD-GYP domain-containing protein [Clostridium aestuarii]MCY6484464.1 HD-GYP domain-containing protein [Clostridium aestuarii]